MSPPYPTPRAMLADARRRMALRLEALLEAAADQEEATLATTLAERLAASPELPLQQLAARFALSPLEQQIVLLLLVTEVDEALLAACARAHGEPTHRWLTPGLLWRLLGLAAQEAEARLPFAPGGTFERHRLVHVTTHANGYGLPLLDCPLKLDDRVVAFALGQEVLDAALVSLVEVAAARGGPAPERFAPAPRRRLMNLLSHWRVRAAPPLLLEGARGAGRGAAAHYLASALRHPLLTMEARHLTTERWLLLRREAMLREAFVHLRWGEGAPDLEEWWPHLGEGVIVSVGAAPPLLEPPPYRIALGAPDAHARRALWRAVLNGQGEPEGLDDLAGQFRLTRGQIEGAAQQARQEAGLRAGVDAAPERDELLAGARAQSSPTLLRLGTRLSPVYGWDNLVLPAARLAQLRAIESHARYGAQVYDEWGFGAKLPYGRAVTALFSGPSGTGKTMAAGILARSLGLDLYTIDLSRVVSKYIGETEKNLDRLFEEAATASVVLFFDEADALFGKRSEVKDAHDRYANIEISFLLQRMEAYEGIAIMATNFSQNIDEAFTRRLQFVVPFPLPSPADRERIWRTLFPAGAPLGADVDMGWLAQQFELTGGHIRNCALAAAFDAAASGSPIGMETLVRAVARELGKLGRPLQRSAFGEWYNVARQG